MTYIHCFMIERHIAHSMMTVYTSKIVDLLTEDAMMLSYAEVQIFIVTNVDIVDYMSTKNSGLLRTIVPP